MEGKVIALGFFDGVHLGHGALLRRTAELARQRGLTPAVFTFDRPPKEVVTGRTVHLINTAEERKALVRRLYGIEEVIFAPFDAEMMRCSWQRFVEEKLVAEQGAVHLVAGHDHRFGHKNEGTPRLLEEKCRAMGLGCDIIPAVEVEGVTVSSTHIRALLEAGEMEKAAAFLGHRHCISRTVCHGQRLGRTIGVPTVNLTLPDNILTPAFGVYVTAVFLPDGTAAAGVTNVGTRPTVSTGDAVSVETFLLDFDGDLYGQEVRVEFCRRLRGEERFPSLAALSEQIKKDADCTRAYFKTHSIE